MHRPSSPPGVFLVLIFRGWVEPRANGSVGSFGKKSPATLPVIDPETFRLVAQCLNHYAIPGPSHVPVESKNICNNCNSRTNSYKRIKYVWTINYWNVEGC
jgi:hypothetical protein